MTTATDLAAEARRHAEDMANMGWHSTDETATCLRACADEIERLRRVADAARRGPCRHAYDQHVCQLCDALAALPSSDSGRGDDATDATKSRGETP